MEAIKECCDEAIVAFGGKPVSGSDPQRSKRPDETVGICQDLFLSPPRVEMAFKQVLKNMTVGETSWQKFYLFYIFSPTCKMWSMVTGVVSSGLTFL